MERIGKAEAPETIGPFRIVRRLGAGGMAEAFEGLRTGPGGFEQRVCVKRVLPAYSSDAELTRLFLREARIAASLSHRNITRVVDFGEDGGCHYLALELVDGLDLRRLLKAIPSHRLPPVVAVLVGIEIAEALEHAHSRAGRTGAVIHRDVSPANILVSVDGDVKLTDFGISKALGDAAITRSDFVRGNVWYMAPEQIEGVRSDPRSDQFSLGVVLYQCLAGRRPYFGPTDLAAMMALSEGRRVPLADAAPDVPAPLVAIVERLLRNDPGERFPSAGALLDALAPLSDVPRGRRELRELVRAHRGAAEKRRAAVRAGPVTAQLSAWEEPKTTPARPRHIVERPVSDAPRTDGASPPQPRALAWAHPAGEALPKAAQPQAWAAAGERATKAPPPPQPAAWAAAGERATKAPPPPQPAAWASAGERATKAPPHRSAGTGERAPAGTKAPPHRTAHASARAGEPAPAKLPAHWPACAPPAPPVGADARSAALPQGSVASGAGERAGDAVDGAPGAAKLPPRWLAYALAPGAWAAADRAAERRRREGRPLPDRDDRDPVVLPSRSSVWWTALAVVVLALVGGATCLITLLV